MGDANPIPTLGDYSKPSHEGYRNTIELPVGTNVVPLRSDTIQLVQNRCSFHGLRSEDPNQHLKDFLKLVDLLDLDVENRERTRMRLFQFSLRDQASNWLERLPAGSITTWEDLTTRLLAQFFPPGRTTKLRNDILMCQQHRGESLSEAWTHFKDLLQKVPHHGIELWLQVQIFYDHVNPVTRRTIDQSAGVNKIATSCEMCNGPHDTQYCMEDPEQAFVEYASSRTNETGSRPFTMNQGPRSFDEAVNAWKEKPNFNWAHAQTFTNPRNGSLSTYLSNYQMKLEKALVDFDSHQEKRLSSLRTQLRQQQDDMISKVNLLWKTIFEKLEDTTLCDTARGPTAQMNFTSTDYHTKEELRSKGIKSLSKLLSPNVETSKTKYTNSENANETNEEVKSKKEFEEETEGETEEEEEDNPEHFDTFPTMKELRYHEWLLKNPRPPWVKAKIETENVNNVKFSCMFGQFNKEQAYLDLESPINIMSRFHYNWIMSNRLEPRRKPSNPKKNCNFVGRVKGLGVFVGNFTYECNFMVLEDTTSVIDHYLGSVVFGKPFMEAIELVYNKKEGTVMFERDKERIIFKMPQKMDMFKHVDFTDRGTDSIPPFVIESDDGNYEKTYYLDILDLGPECKYDEYVCRGIRSLMAAKARRKNKREVT
ncbi:MAK10-like protein [Tanacetum coccineum]